MRPAAQVEVSTKVHCQWTLTGFGRKAKGRRANNAKTEKENTTKAKEMQRIKRAKTHTTKAKEEGKSRRVMVLWFALHVASQVIWLRIGPQQSASEVKPSVRMIEQGPAAFLTDVRSTTISKSFAQFEQFTTTSGTMRRPEDSVSLFEGFGSPTRKSRR